MSKAKLTKEIERFLELNGDVYVIDDDGLWVKFDTQEVKPSPERPHGLKYALTLHDDQGNRIIGFDNAHPYKGSSGPAGKKKKFYDHRHRYERTRRYEFKDTDTLLDDFWKAVDRILKDKKGGKK